ncbi:hypothetical protein Csa_019911 [Cucumis sativus]|nr:hypothetical protein Csa_019911 [Cucumis sativus]
MGGIVATTPSTLVIASSTFPNRITARSQAFERDFSTSELMRMRFGLIVSSSSLVAKRWRKMWIGGREVFFFVGCLLGKIGRS